MKTLLFEAIRKVILKLRIVFPGMPSSLRFAVLNRRYWKKKYGDQPLDKGYVLSETSDNIYLALGGAILTNFMALRKKAKILFFVENDKQNNSQLFRDLRESFSNFEFWYFEDFIERSRKRVDKIVEREAKKITTVQELYDYNYEDLYIGDLMYDDVMRTGKWYCTVWEIDERVDIQLKRYIRVLEALKEIDSKYDIQETNFSHSIGLIGLIPRYYANKKKMNIMGVAGCGPIRKAKEFDGERIICTSTVPHDTVEEIYQDPNLRASTLLKAEEYLHIRMDGNLKHLDTKRAFAKDSNYYLDQDSFRKDYQIKGSKKMVFVLLHFFTDYPNHFKLVYKDYYEWMVNTVEHAAKVTDVQWVWKEHPVTHFYPPHDVDLPAYFKKFEHLEHFTYLSEGDNFNAKSLKNIADVIVTCAGTGALEFSCFGVPAVICSHNYFSTFGICHNADTHEGYLALLDKVGELGKLTTEQQENAKILFYLIFGVVAGNNWNSDAFLPMSDHEQRIANDHREVFDYYLSYLGKEEELKFSKRLNEFLENENEEIFFRDDFFAEVENRKPF